MVNHCAVCGRILNIGIVPEEFEKSSEIYISGMCGKCDKNEKYNKEFLDLNFGEHEQFIQERIKQYGS